jgi:hypothetical protein
MKSSVSLVSTFLPSFVCCYLVWLFGVNQVSAVADDVDPRRPAAIEAEEVPIVSAEIFDRLAQYQNVRGASFSGWAPDGSGILIRTRFGNASQLHRVYEPGGRREQITFFEEPVRGYFIPESQDGDLLLSMSRGGDDN